jgi:hypothetical protein
MDRAIAYIHSNVVNNILKASGYIRLWTAYSADLIEQVLRVNGRLLDGEYYIGFDPIKESLMFSIQHRIKPKWYHKLGLWLLRR